MIYFILLSLFSLFIGINNVNADAWTCDETGNHYVVFDKDRFDYVFAKKSFEYFTPYRFEFSSGTYTVNDYNSFLFENVSWGAEYDKSGNPKDYNNKKVYFGDSMILKAYDNFGCGVELTGTNPNNIWLENLVFGDGYKTVYSYYGSFNGNSTFLPVYAKNVKSEVNAFFKIPSSSCNNLGNLCSHSVGTDGDYIIVQFAWKDGDFKDIITLGGEEIAKTVEYTVNIYLDDKLKDSYNDVGTVGKTVTLKGLSDDKLKADENNKYDVVLVDGTNEFELRYYTSTYGTAYQQINTDNSELYIPFGYDKLKSMFPGINFELWTSYEQFNFVLMFNLFFILFLIFISFIILKIFYFLKGWFL